MLLLSKQSRDIDEKSNVLEAISEIVSLSNFVLFSKSNGTLSVYRFCDSVTAHPPDLHHNDCRFV